MAGNVDEIECTIHLGLFQEPKLLDCHHTFCRKCLEDLASANLQVNSNYIKCPLCNKISRIPDGGVKKFSTNFYLSTPSTSLARGGNKLYCSKHSQDELICFCEECNTIVCSTCLLGQHKNHKFLIIEESKDVISKDYQDQKEGLKKKLEELKTVKGIAEESLKKLTEYRQTELNSFQTELQNNFEENQEKLNIVISKVDTQISQIETTAAINMDVATPKPVDVLRRKKVNLELILWID